jgi:hypothetical protein
MKRLIVFWMCCSLVSLASFAVLLYEDRRLGVPLPYSVGLAFATIVALPGTPLIFWADLRAIPRRLMARLRARMGPTRATSRRNAAEGVVLLDFSTAAGFKDRAA